MPAKKPKIAPMQREEYSQGMVKRIKHLRKTRFSDKRGSKSAAAAAAGATPSDWRGYEEGVLPGADKLYQICTAFDCDANWLLGIKVDHKKKLTASQQRLLKALIDVQEALHVFDSMFTDCLINLRDVLADPEIAQAQCFRLYAIATELVRIREQLRGAKKRAEGDERNDES